MKIRPLGDRLIVKRLDQEEKTSGGIIIPDSAKEKPLEGRVRAAGPGKTNDKGESAVLAVSEGDRILFGKYAGTEIKIQGEDLLILREDDVLAIVEG
jgi:chaperonin GroES